ncbi:hypothetical protein EJ05DRAFT_291713 [Pseudovirgaria hyperparasitica]|uniref:Uncharacterized protein n=1 Tax=Pseudovirgaria hyperparasitica TaxID=470096 RepID=A0A6A6WEQ7_9PEZI|nr:uncharacterized protein EJ05DRAFT_291713 [Pseudovirgaria hyperparasitica]KAF2760639.1 hypothetical protein EJ05DRAFT_291713 [Pseudovirgaria hyperparasitica]
MIVSFASASDQSNTLCSPQWCSYCSTTEPHTTGDVSSASHIAQRSYTVASGASKRRRRRVVSCGVARLQFTRQSPRVSCRRLGPHPSASLPIDKMHYWPNNAMLASLRWVLPT